MIKEFFIKAQRKLGKEVILTNVNKTQFAKNALMLYLVDPFLGKNDSRHQAIQQIIIIAKIFKELGYNLDVIDYRSSNIRFDKMYDAVFDICVKDQPIYKNDLKVNAKRVVYLTGSESEFANNAEFKRIQGVYERRGVYLLPRRQAPPICREIESFDMAIMIGNEYTFSTYDDLKFKNYALVPNTGYDFRFDFDINKKDTKSFLFFGSAGCVHKGLDLLLEVFSKLDSSYKLYVCGGYKDEGDFVGVYYEELFRTNNIVPIGYIDVWSKKFRDLCNVCTFTILPSCSEGCAGTISTCMSAGVIPICSRNCGYDEEEVILLDDCTIDTIMQTVVDVSNMNIDDIKLKSSVAVRLSKTKYSIQNYYVEMKRGLEKVL